MGQRERGRKIGERTGKDSRDRQTDRQTDRHTHTHTHTHTLRVLIGLKDRERCDQSVGRVGDTTNVKRHLGDFTSSPFGVVSLTIRSQ